MHKSNVINNINTPNKNLSDSKESTTSKTPSDNLNNGNELTLFAEYDEYLRLLNQEIKEIVTLRDVLLELTESLGEVLTLKICQGVESTPANGVGQENARDGRSGE